MSKVWLIEALPRKRGANELAEEPTGIGGKPNLFSTLRSDQPEATTRTVGRPGARDSSTNPPTVKVRRALYSLPWQN